MKWSSKGPTAVPRVQTSQYAGTERRRTVRRVGGDRRSQVRWEPDLGGRRQNVGRRVIDDSRDYR